MHCPECGFVNSEGANYCQKCGAFLSDVQNESEDTTAAWQLDETGDIRPVDPDVVAQSGTLVIRSGGGRAGETFQVAGDQMRIGRSPDAEVFLDDLGSLNGTYVNRRRIESHKLVDGDELQIGKYKLTYLA